MSSIFVRHTFGTYYFAHNDTHMHFHFFLDGSTPSTPVATPRMSRISQQSNLEDVEEVDLSATDSEAASPAKNMVESTSGGGSKSSTEVVLDDEVNDSAPVSHDEANAPTAAE